MIGHSKIDEMLNGTVLKSNTEYEAYGRKVFGYVGLGSLSDGCTLLDVAKSLVEIGVSPKHIKFIGADTSTQVQVLQCDYDRYDFPTTNEEFDNYCNVMGRKYDFYRMEFKVSYFKASNWNV